MKLINKINDKTKNVVFIFVTMFGCVFLFFGVLYYGIKKYMIKEAKIVENNFYLSVNKSKTTDKKKVLKIFLSKERKFFCNKFKRWSKSIIFITFAFLVIVVLFFSASCIPLLFTKIIDFFPIFKWPTTEETNNIIVNLGFNNILNLPDDFPSTVLPLVIFKNPNFNDPLLLLSMLYYICILICVLFLLKNILTYISRFHGLMIIDRKLSNNKKMSSYKESINSPIPNQDKYEIKE